VHLNSEVKLLSTGKIYQKIVCNYIYRCTRWSESIGHG